MCIKLKWQSVFWLCVTQKEPPNTQHAAEEENKFKHLKTSLLYLKERNLFTLTLIKANCYYDWKPNFFFLLRKGKVLKNTALYWSISKQIEFHNSGLIKTIYSFKSSMFLWKLGERNCANVPLPSKSYVIRVTVSVNCLQWALPSFCFFRTF